MLSFLIISFLTEKLNPIRPGLRGPGDQTHSCQSETSHSMMPKICDLVFIFKTCSDQILAKLINRGVAAALFSSRRPKNPQYGKLSSAWKLLKLTSRVTSILGREERFWT